MGVGTFRAAVAIAPTSTPRPLQNIRLMLVAPTELRHPAFRMIARDGKGSNVPETWGCDFGFLVTRDNQVLKYGIQRKELQDLISSVNDGRLAQEVKQMCVLEQGLLIVEGQPKFTMDGALVGDKWGAGWSRQQHTSLLLSVQSESVWVLSTSDVSDTARVLLDFEKWARKPEHTSLKKRSGPVFPYGTKRNRDYQLHLIMGLPGVGLELANRILDQVGMPYGLRVGIEELVQVEGIGKKKAQQIVDAIVGMP